MRPAARQGFPGFTVGFEGHVDSFYRDVEDFVSIGDGLLADPISLIAGLEFVVDGSPVGWHDVTNAWVKVKTAPIDASKGGKVHEFAALTKVRATEASIAHLVDRKLSQIEADMLRIFPAWETWPADAQLGVLSMCWAMGSHRIALSYPHFMAACRAFDWDAAAAQCHMSEVGQTGSFKRRNLANVVLFKNAARSTDPDVLVYPRNLGAA